mmetsp:Transcript_38839/g.90572  ORF Transcript_38839/g.90572 Transcript_38839/m.90572 type:complete len:204 (-) Transcript_38839:510-1121(-)
MPMALERSAVKSFTNCTRAGEAGGISVMSLAMVSLISAGGSNSLIDATVVSVVFCCPPDQSVPTPTTKVPTCTTPLFQGRVQMMLLSETSTNGLHGYLPVPPTSSATTSLWLVPKFVPVMVMVASSPALTCAGSTTLIVGLGKETWLEATESFSKSPEAYRTIMSCCLPTQGGETHVRRVPAMSDTTREPHSLLRSKSMEPLR